MARANSRRHNASKDGKVQAVLEQMRVTKNPYGVPDYQLPGYPKHASTPASDNGTVSTSTGRDPIFSSESFKKLASWRFKANGAVTETPSEISTQHVDQELQTDPELDTLLDDMPDIDDSEIHFTYGIAPDDPETNDSEHRCDDPGTEDLFESSLLSDNDFSEILDTELNQSTSPDILQENQHPETSPLKSSPSHQETPSPLTINIKAKPVIRYAPPPAAFPQPLLQLDPTGSPRPFARNPFPRPTKEMSDVAGISAHTVLRTCFRIGEALRAASTSLTGGRNVMIELFARVTASHRAAHRQHFTFADLFHDRPPFLAGIYHKWATSGLWDADSAAFLGEAGKGRVCRGVGILKRGAEGWEMMVLDIWQADFEDVEWAMSFVCGATPVQDD